MRRLLLATVAAFVLAAPVAAQMDMNMPGMKMAPKPAVRSMAKRAPKPVARRSAGHPVKASKRVPGKHGRQPSSQSAAQHPDPARSDASMNAMPGMAMPMSGMAMPMSTTANMPPPSSDKNMQSMPGMNMTKEAAATAGSVAGAATDNMAGMPAMASGTEEIGSTPAPAPPTDHAADAVFGAGQMAASRKMLRYENGGMPAYSVLFNLAEYRVQKGSNGYRWDGEGWFGGDINRLVIKTEGGGVISKGVDSAEVQAVYSRSINPWFNLQAGVRHDFAPGPARNYATVGVEGIIPYWFEVQGALFLSDKGDLLGRVEGYYDQRITQKLVLQPRMEINLAAQDVPAQGIGAGLSDAELGLRLRYEIKREFAPYIGVSWDTKAGASARFARAAGDQVQSRSVVFGIRSFF